MQSMQKLDVIINTIRSERGINNSWCILASLLAAAM